MLKKWLNYILYLSSYIYSKKIELVTLPVFKSFLKVIWIIFLEIYLAIISLPILLFIPTKKIQLKYKGRPAHTYRFSFIYLMILIAIALIIVSTYSLIKLLPLVLIVLIIIELALLALFSICGKLWTNVTIKYFIYVHQQKEKLLQRGVFASLFYSIYIILLEAVLFFISLPLYIFIKPHKFKKQGNISIDDYVLRRKTTFIYLGFFLLIFIIQFILAVIIYSHFIYPSTASFNIT
jgi:hypothetical protein